MKLLKLETDESKLPGVSGVAAPAVLTKHQTLEGHKDTVHLLAWNDTTFRLATADIGGQIIVWTNGVDDTWHEDMVNNRNESKVNDLKWSPNGSQICIIYEDGEVVVGSVEGGRLWGKSTGQNLHKMVWTLNSKLLLLFDANNDMFAFNNEGISKEPHLNFQLPKTLVTNSSISRKIVAVCWNLSSTSSESLKLNNGQCRSLKLLVALSCGSLYLSSDTSSEPIVRNLNHRIKHCAWDSSGKILSVCCVQVQKSGNGEAKCYIAFYDEMLRLRSKLAIPGEPEMVCWSPSGFKISVFVKNILFFANVRYDKSKDYIFSIRSGNNLLYMPRFIERKSDSDSKHTILLHQCDLFVRQIRFEHILVSFIIL